MELGKGRFGVVFLVKEKESQNCYAAKYLKTRTRSYKDQALAEIDLLKSLNHDHIINYIDSYVDFKAVVIVMEYLEGGELFVKISDEDYVLTESDCSIFMSQICTGVQYLHQNLVVHLDLKVRDFQKDKNNI